MPCGSGSGANACICVCVYICMYIYICTYIYPCAPLAGCPFYYYLIPVTFILEIAATFVAAAAVAEQRKRPGVGEGER